MPADAIALGFGDYHLHPTQGLSRSGHCLRVTPKSLLLLWQLAQRAGEVVTKEEIFSAVWPGVVVTDAALSTCISELRRVLEDDARQPRFLETVHRVGFRFLPDCQQRPDSDAGRAVNFPSGAPLDYESEFQQLTEFAGLAERGFARVALIEGQPASSATQLCQALAGALENGDTWQCVTVQLTPPATPGDAYKPLVELIRSLCLQPGGIQYLASLRRLAPSWLAELPVLVDRDELTTLRLRTAGVTTTHLERELNAFLTHVCHHRPLLVVLEQLQWADEYTLEWLLSLSREVAMPILVVACASAPPPPGQHRHLKPLQEQLQANDSLLELQPATQQAPVDEALPATDGPDRRGPDPQHTAQFYLQGAELNARRGAHRLALAHLALGQQQLERSTGEERKELELALCLATARAHTALAGIGVPEAERCYQQAHRLQSRLESRQSRFEALWELWVYYLNSAPLARAAGIVEELMALAEELNSPELLLHAHHANWGMAFMLGDLAAVQRHTREGMTLCSHANHPHLAITRGCTPPDAHAVNHQAAVCAGFFRAWVAGLMGRQEDARAGLDAGVSHARDVGHPYSLDVTLVVSAAASCAANDPEPAHRYALEAECLSREHDYIVLQAWASVYRGWAEVAMGEVDQGLRRMEDGLALCDNPAHWLFRPFQYTLHAEALLSNGLHEQARHSLQKAFEIADRTGDRVAWAEMHRLRGELTLATDTRRDAVARAEHDLVYAMEFAMKQNAVLLIERSRSSLKRLRGRGSTGQTLFRSPS